MSLLRALYSLVVSKQTLLLFCIWPGEGNVEGSLRKEDVGKKVATNLRFYFTGF